jgi:L-threonylcarbamoyladenylate synthase
VYHRLLAIKKRSIQNPFLILIPDISHLKNWVLNVNLLQNQLIDRYWPGPLTLIFDSFNHQTVAIRFPKFKPLNRILSMIGQPLYSTSVNYSGEAACTNLDLVPNDIKIQCDFIANFKGSSSVPSTVVDARFEEIKILRKGAIIL